MSSERVDRFWKKFREWYHNSVEAEAPDDFAKIIDGASRETLRIVLARMPHKFPKFPPRFGEFAAFFVESTPRQENTVAIDWQQRLNDFTGRVVARYWDSWSEAQQRGRWTYTGTGDPRTGEGFRFTGLVIPADPANNRIALRYMIEDFQQ